jgi:hypothetical protein
VCIQRWQFTLPQYFPLLVFTQCNEGGIQHDEDCSNPVVLKATTLPTWVCSGSSHGALRSCCLVGLGSSRLYGRKLHAGLSLGRRSIRCCVWRYMSLLVTLFTISQQYLNKITYHSIRLDRLSQPPLWLLMH